ncbi:17489_t:CDS:2 [Gigaspora rosea]|nr:17489_t:CDS:2 [Gigaspora rosea]
MKALAKYHAEECNTDIEELLRVIEVLTTIYNHQIISADIIDIKKSKKPKLLGTVKFAEFVLQDLVKRGLVLQDIILSRLHVTEYISCTLVIKGLVDSAKEIVKAQEWKYWSPSNEGKINLLEEDDHV